MVSESLLKDPYPDMTELIKQDLCGISAKQIGSFQLIRAKQEVYLFNCLYGGVPAVVKYFGKEEDRREIRNYSILMQNGIPTIKILASGNATLVMEDITRSDGWRLGIPEDLSDKEVANCLAHWYFDFHEKGARVPELDGLYFEYDAITKENIEALRTKLPEAEALFRFVLSNFEKLHALLYKPSFTLTYNDFYWTNFVVRKDKTAAMMFDYNLLGKGYRISDFRNLRSLSETAYKEFMDEYERLYFLKHGNKMEDEYAVQQIDDVASPLFSLITAYERERFPEWAEDAKNEAINGALLAKARQLIS